MSRKPPRAAEEPTGPESKPGAELEIVIDEEGQIGRASCRERV
jgi:hypothetical protein